MYRYSKAGSKAEGLGQCAISFIAQHCYSPVSPDAFVYSDPERAF
jgi:hypothetical protein